MLETSSTARLWRRRKSLKSTMKLWATMTTGTREQRGGWIGEVAIIFVGKTLGIEEEVGSARLDRRGWRLNE